MISASPVSATRIRPAIAVHLQTIDMLAAPTATSRSARTYDNSVPHSRVVGRRTSGSQRDHRPGTPLPPLRLARCSDAGSSPTPGGGRPVPAETKAIREPQLTVARGWPVHSTSEMAGPSEGQLPPPSTEHSRRSLCRLTRAADDRAGRLRQNTHRNVRWPVVGLLNPSDRWRSGSRNLRTCKHPCQTTLAGLDVLADTNPANDLNATHPTAYSRTLLWPWIPSCERSQLASVSNRPQRRSQIPPTEPWLALFWRS